MRSLVVSNGREGARRREDKMARKRCHDHDDHDDDDNYDEGDHNDPNHDHDAKMTVHMTMVIYI